MTTPDDTKTELFTELGLGTRLRRLLERLTADAESLQADHALPFKASYFPVIYGLHKSGELAIRDIAFLAGFSHSAISQTVKKLNGLGIVETSQKHDGRERIIRLSAKGKVYVRELIPNWRLIETAMKDVIAESGHDILAAITATETALENESLISRVETLHFAAKPEKLQFDMVPYDTKYKQAFYDINIKWVRELFKVEPIDEKILSDPEGEILDHGGEIFFTVMDGIAVGTVAMKNMDGGRFELTKLGVCEAARGSGAGSALTRKVIERFQARGGKCLFLETNDKLKNSIRLYERYNFVEMPNPVPSPYVRSNYYMEWRG